MTTNSKEYARKYYQEHKELYRAASKRYQERKRQEKKLNVTNPRLFDPREDYGATVREKFQEIPKRETTYNQKYYLENRDRIRAQQKESRRRKKAAEKRKIYYEANKERILSQQREYQHRKTRKKRLSKTFLGRVRLKFEKIFG